MSTPQNNRMDPMAFLKTLWGSAGMPLPGLVTPTLDTDELEKRITDLKAVEGWLKTNLGVLQMTIQGLEVQRATLTTLQAMSHSLSTPPAENSDAANAINPAMLNPLTNPDLSTLWPWNLMQAGSATELPSMPSGKPTASNAATPAPKKAAPKTKRS
ncbi:MAG: PhaM family polyhydroxyalkanoate granule multifunctional regulatory protein [Rugosibacter sp.]|nr:hypothetical protein [Rugosibacter sp.]